MTFILLILLTAFLMEGVGSYISVIGLSALFAGDWVIIAMAVILDIAKVTTVSFIYQYWSEIRKTMRAYMTAAVIVLMTITSAGAFGYLSGAFQKAVQPNRESALKVDSLTREMTALTLEKKELTDAKLKISQQIANVPTSEEDTARRRLISSFKPELDRASKRLEVVNKRVDELRSKVLAAESENIEKDVHAGPITYVAKAFNLSLEDSSKYIILLIVSVFDPLAIMLVLAGNFLIARRNEHEDEHKVAQVYEESKIKVTHEKHDEHKAQDCDLPVFTNPELDERVELTQEPLPAELKSVVTAKPFRQELAERVKKVKLFLKPSEPEEIKPIEVTIEQPDLPAPNELIVEEFAPVRSSLQDTKVGIEDALFKHGVPAVSKKRAQYAA